METTTSDGGAQAQPQEPEAVTTGYNADQVITTDDNGTPSLAPVTSTDQSPSAPAADEPAETIETQPEAAQASADDTEPSVEEWAKSKNLPLDDPVKLAKMYRDAEKRMHEASQKAREFEQAATQVSTVEYTGDPAFDQYAETVNQLLVKNTVRDFFEANPDAREYESKMAEIVVNRPHLKNDLDALYALARSDPSREAELRKEGGREALTNVAQKMQQIPPQAQASTGYSTEAQITPQNVDQLVAQNDMKWFMDHRDEINAAMAG